MALIVSASDARVYTYIVYMFTKFHDSNSIHEYGGIDEICC